MNALLLGLAPAAEPPPGVSISAIAEVGALVSDPARTNMLVALFGGDDLTARELADCAGITPQTASGHLSKLMAAGLIKMRRVGRYHYHSLASSEIILLIQALHVAGHSLTGRAPSCRGEGAPAFTAPVRKCRGHLAGPLAISLAQALTTEDGGGRLLTAAGRDRLMRWGVEGPVLDTCEPTVDLCLDWTEHRPHISGALGTAIMDRAIKVGWLKVTVRASDLQITPLGVRGFEERFGLGVAKLGSSYGATL